MKLTTLLILGLCFTYCVIAQEKSKPVSKQQLEKWFNQLSEGNFRERRTASNSLLKAGKPALPFLAKGSERKDTELSNRCFSIIVAMYRGKNKNLSSAAKNTLGDLEKSPNKTLALRAEKIVQQKLQEDTIAAVAAIKKFGGTIKFDQSGKAESVRIAGKTNAAALLLHLKELTGLQKLYLEKTNVIDNDLKYLKGMSDLQELFLNNTKVTGSGLANLKRLTKLFYLNLSNTMVTDVSLVHLKGMANLQVLYLYSTPVTDAGLKHLKGMTNLEWLKLDNTQVTDAGLTHLKTLTNLKNLSLYRTRVTEAGVKKLKTALPKCSIWWK